LNYIQFIDYWKTSINLIKNLESLENTLERFNSSTNGTSAQHNSQTDPNGVVSGSSTFASQLDSVARPVFSSNQTSLWMNDFQNCDMQNLQVNRDGTTAGTQYQQPLVFDAFAAHLDSAQIGNEIPFVGIDGTFENFGLDMDMGLQVDLPSYLNGFFSGTVMG